MKNRYIVRTKTPTGWPLEDIEANAIVAMYATRDEARKAAKQFSDIAIAEKVEAMLTASA